MTKLEEEKLLKAYRIGFSDGVINALEQGLTLGLYRNNRKHIKQAVNIGNFLNSNIKIFLKNKNNRKITLKKFNLTSEEKEKMKIKVEDKSKTEKVKVKVNKKK